MFLVGDKVVHPMHGAGVIEQITRERMGGQINSYYVFRMPVGGLTLKIPTDSWRELGLRRLSTAEHIRQVLAAIPALEIQMSTKLEPAVPGQSGPAEERGSVGSGTGHQGPHVAGYAPGPVQW